MKLTAALAVGAAALLLTGCSSAAASPPATVTTPGPTVTLTATPSPTAAARQPDDRLTALDAWTACSAAAADHYIFANPGSQVRPWDPKFESPKQNSDGSFTATIGIVPAPGVQINGGIIAICTISGTLGTPVLVSLTMKDI